jgi:hypothetical protein
MFNIIIYKLNLVSAQVSASLKLALSRKKFDRLTSFIYQNKKMNTMKHTYFYTKNNLHELELSEDTQIQSKNMQVLFIKLIE